MAMTKVAAGTDLDLDSAIVDIVSRGAVEVPPYPAVAMKVEQLVRRGDFGLDELAKLVASDQALAADALRCANSAFYSRGGQVSSLNAAIGRIGAKEVARLALASGLGVLARKAGPLAVLKRRVWLEALAVGAISQELAKKRGVSADEAFVCGLLHDFGKMIAIACIEDILQRVRTRPLPMDYWTEVVERYHVELGLVLAARWRLPVVVADVISLHHREDVAGAAEQKMVELVQIGDEVTGLLTDRTWLDPEDLGAISGLSAPECELVSRVTDRLPGFIASFENATAPTSGPSVIDAAASEQFAAGPTPVDFPVTVTIAREARKYQATGIAQTNLMIAGAAPLPENVLMELQLGSEPPVACWATAKLSWQEGGKHLVLVQPFALNGAAHGAWKKLVQRAVPAA